MFRVLKRPIIYRALTVLPGGSSARLSCVKLNFGSSESASPIIKQFSELGEALNRFLPMLSGGHSTEGMFDTK
jgi:hypothetical protein